MQPKRLRQFITMCLPDHHFRLLNWNSTIRRHRHQIVHHDLNWTHRRRINRSPVLWELWLLWVKEKKFSIIFILTQMKTKMQHHTLNIIWTICFGLISNQESSAGSANTPLGMMSSPLAISIGSGTITSQ